MNAIGNVIIYCLIEMSLIIIDFFLYFSEGGAIKGPLVVGGALAIGVLILTTMALYEAIKHRHDKEQW
jgi:hypothetical protein